jgi:hypothetical protein
VQYKIREITGICRGCTLPVFTGKYPANAGLFRSNYCFFVLFVPLPVEAGFRCSFLVASNGFVRTNLTFTCREKIMHLYEWGILGVKALDFYPLFDCADCSHCSCCCDNFVAALASIAPSHLGSERSA